MRVVISRVMRWRRLGFFLSIFEISFEEGDIEFVSLKSLVAKESLTSGELS